MERDGFWFCFGDIMGDLNIVVGGVLMMVFILLLVCFDRGGFW